MARSRAAGRNSIGTGVMGGMLAATIFALLLVPLFFQWIEGGSERLLARFRRAGPHEDAEPAAIETQPAPES